MKDISAATILAQAEHLIDEIDALASQVHSMPDLVLSRSPLKQDLSIKEIYALIGLYDRCVYIPTLRRIVAEERPILQEPDDLQLLRDREWSNAPFNEILDFVRDARTDLVEILRDLPERAWSRQAQVGDDVFTVVDVGYALIQHDAELLRIAAMRLHDSRITP